MLTRRTLLRAGSYAFVGGTALAGLVACADNRKIPSTRLPLQPPTTTSLLDSDRSYEWTGSETDTVHTLLGKPSLLLHAANGSSVTSLRRITMDASDVFIFLSLYIDSTVYEDIHVITTGVLVLRDTKEFNFPISNLRYLRPGWNRISIPKSSFVAIGDAMPADWSQVSSVYLRVGAKPGKAVNVSFAEFLIVPSPPSGMLTVTHDDGNESDYSLARPILQKFGFRASIFVATTKQVGVPGKMSVTQLHRLQDLGWDVCSHSVDHVDLETLNDSDLTHEVRDSQRWLFNNGFAKGSRFFVSPATLQSPRQLNAIRQYYQGSLITFDMDETIPPGEPYLIRRRGIHASTSVGDVTSWINTALDEHEWLILNFHDLTEGNPQVDLEWSAERYTSVLAYASKMMIPVVTVSDVYDSYNQTWPFALYV